MLSSMRNRVRAMDGPTAAVALLALCLALGGTAIAAKSITGKQVKNSSLTGKDVKDESLSAADFSGSIQGPKGDTGAAGPKGDTGAAGPAGSALAYARVSGPTNTSAVDASVSQGLTLTANANVGKYCMDYTGGVAKNVQATVDASAATQRDAIFVTSVPATVQGAGCPAESDIFVTTFSNAVAANTSFYISVIA